MLNPSTSCSDSVAGSVHNDLAALIIEQVQPDVLLISSRLDAELSELFRIACEYMILSSLFDCLRS